jgi:hypothetical protein
MDGQTTIEPCAICGEPSEREVEIRPAEMDSGRQRARKAQDRHVNRMPVKRWLCSTHLKSHDPEWRDRQAERRAWQRRKLKSAQAESPLFDASEGAPHRWDAA